MSSSDEQSCIEIFKLYAENARYGSSMFDTWEAAFEAGQRYAGMNSNNDLMDPNWKPQEQDEFEKNWSNFYNSFQGVPNIVHVKNWAHDLWKHEREKANLEKDCIALSYQDEIKALKAKALKLVEALIRLRDCDFVITPLDRMDAVRDIAHEALKEWGGE